MKNIRELPIDHEEMSIDFLTFLLDINHEKSISGVVFNALSCGGLEIRINCNMGDKNTVPQNLPLVLIIIGFQSFLKQQL